MAPEGLLDDVLVSQVDESQVLPSLMAVKEVSYPDSTIFEMTSRRRVKGLETYPLGLLEESLRMDGQGVHLDGDMGLEI